MSWRLETVCVFYIGQRTSSLTVKIPEKPIKILEKNCLPRTASQWQAEDDFGIFEHSRYYMVRMVQALMGHGATLHNCMGLIILHTVLVTFVSNLLRTCSKPTHHFTECEYGKWSGTENFSKSGCLWLTAHVFTRHLAQCHLMRWRWRWWFVFAGATHEQTFHTTQFHIVSLFFF